MSLSQKFQLFEIQAEQKEYGFSLGGKVNFTGNITSLMLVIDNNTQI